MTTKTYNVKISDIKGVEITPQLTKKQENFVWYINNKLDLCIEEMAERVNCLNTCDLSDPLFNEPYQLDYYKETLDSLVSTIFEAKELRLEFNKALLDEEITDKLLDHYFQKASDLELYQTLPLTTEADKFCETVMHSSAPEYEFDEDDDMDYYDLLLQPMKTKAQLQELAAQLKKDIDDGTVTGNYKNLCEGWLQKTEYDIENGNYSEEETVELKPIRDCLGDC